MWFLDLQERCYCGLVVERIMSAKTDMKVIGYLYRKQKLKQKQKKKTTSYHIKVRRKTDLKMGS